MHETKSYEIRTKAWSCTCAAFAFAAFNNASRNYSHGGCGSDGAIDPQSDDEERGFERVGEEDEEESVRETEGFRERTEWGGLMDLYRDGEGKGDMPLCKHLLACVLAEWWDVAGRMVEKKVVARGEIAGWAAGWGG